MRKTEVISARVTVEVAQAIRAKALANNQTISTWINDVATTVTPNEVSHLAQSVQLSDEVSETYTNVAISMGGSAIVGILAYKGIKGLLLDRKAKNEISYPESDIEVLSVLIGVAAAIVTGVGIHKFVMPRK